jgi:hypothetical protein
MNPLYELDTPINLASFDRVVEDCASEQIK